MGLRIASNAASNMVQKNLRSATDKQDAEFAKLSSGKRITKSADDAAGLAIAKKVEAEVKSLQQAQRNASNGISMVQVAEGGLNETTNILTRLRELSIQSASDTIGEKERGYLNLEYVQLTEELDRIAQTTSFNGMPLLNGEAEGTLDFQVGAYGGENNRIQFEASAADSTASTLGLEGSNIEDKDNAIDNLNQIDEAIDTVSGQRAYFGSLQSRLQTSVNNLGNSIVNQEAARSNIEDVDVAESTAKLAAVSVMKQAGISTLAQANNLPNTALRLLG